MSRLRTLVFTVVFSIVSLPIFLGISTAEFVRRGWIAQGSRIWARVFLWLARHLLGVRLAVSGRPPAEAAIVASKHQSMFETVAFFVVLDHPAFVLKRELMTIPFWRFLARRQKAMPIDRGGSAKSLREMTRIGREVAGEGRPIVIFPEGSRVPYGETPELKPGVAGLYKLLRLPVVPVALDSGRVWPRGGAVIRPGTIHFAFGEPIPPGLEREEFERRLHAAINREPA